MKWLVLFIVSTFLMADDYCEALHQYENKNYMQSKKILDPLAFKGKPKEQNLLALVNHNRGNDSAARKWFQSAAVQGDLKAAYNLGVFYYLQNKKREAIKWMHKAEALSQGKAALGFLYTNDDLKKAKEYLYEATLAGEKMANAHLCALLLEKKSKEDAKYEQVCQGKEVLSSYETGKFYASPKKYASRAKAIKYLEYAAKKEDPKAMNLLGELLMQRNGSMDQDRALQYFLKASAKGNVEAKVNAAWLYYTGLRWTRDPARGKRMLEEALAVNNAKAQFYMGVLLLKGMGFSGGTVARNVKKGWEYIKKAAEQNDTDALAFLIKNTKNTKEKRAYQEQLKSYEKEQAKHRAIHFLYDGC